MAFDKKFHLHWQFQFPNPGIILALLLILGKLSTINAVDPNNTVTPEPKNQATNSDAEERSLFYGSGGKPSGTGVSAYELKVKYIPGVRIECTSTSQSYKDGYKCTDGSSPNPDSTKLSEEEIRQNRAEWKHPGNLELLTDAVPKAERSCDGACESQYCYYSMTTFNYVCDKKDSKDSKATQDFVLKIKQDNKKYNLLNDGKICWSGGALGKDYNPKEINQRDIAAARWFKDRNNFIPVEEKLSVHCKHSCKFNEELSTFICKSRAPKLFFPVSLFVLSILLTIIAQRYQCYT